MILQREIARNGQPILKIDGRSIVSSFDPMKEARAWAEAALREVGDRDTVVILGAGCGYHIAALHERNPSLSLLTIEANADVAAFAREVLESQPEIDPAYFGEILVASQPIQLTESLILRDFMSRRYAVVTHAGLASIRPEWTREMANFLNGRDSLSFLLQLRMRPELYALFDEAKIATIKEQTGPISILTIRQMFAERAQSTRERAMWRVLEELIA